MRRNALTNRQLWLALIGGTLAVCVCFAVLAGGIVYLLTGGW
jgi:hypothetical protein